MNQVKKCLSRLNRCLGAAIMAILLFSAIACQSASGEVTLSRMFDGIDSDEEVQHIAFVNIDDFDDLRNFWIEKAGNDSVVITLFDFEYDIDSATVPFNNGEIRGVIMEGISYDIVFQDINNFILKCDGKTINYASTSHMDKLVEESEPIRYIRHRGQGILPDPDVDYTLEITIFDYPKADGEKVKLARVDGEYCKVNDDGTIDINWYDSSSPQEPTPGKISFESKEGEDMRVAYEFAGEEIFDLFSKVAARETN